MTAPTDPWIAPTLADVGAILRARTKDLAGAELGTFTANTRPTDAEATTIIGMAYAEVSALAGGNIGERCGNLAHTLATIRAAAWIELAYWPEQVRSDRSVYAELITQWENGIDALRDCVAGNLPSDGGTEDGAAGYRFGVLDVHGWTASPYYGAPVVPAEEDPTP